MNETSTSPADTLNEKKPELWIYHNPRCSKSRATLEILQAHDVKLNIILYLQQPPEISVLKQLAALLDTDARGIMRVNDAEYRQLGLENSNLTEADLFTALAENIRLLQRPIVVRGEQAVIGRPPANVKKLLPESFDVI